MIVKNVGVANCEQFLLDNCVLQRPLSDVLADLRQFENLLRKWQRIQNLVSRETLTLFWDRHILDSLQLLPMIEPHVIRCLDIGSGGGFPIIPLAIALKGQGKNFVLVESNRRKVSFLRAVSRELALDLKVYDCRMEAVSPDIAGSIDMFTSRATDSLKNLLSLMHPHWQKQTQGLLHKGAEYGAELEEASANWAFDVICVASKTDEYGQILHIRNLTKKTG